MKLLLKIRYIGTNFCGFSVQPNGETVQGALCRAAHSLYGAKCDITGCSRTDSGVHANEFYATLSPHIKGAKLRQIPIERTARALNSFLPRDIAVMNAFEVYEGFHARYDAEYKEYIYKIWNASVRDPFLDGFAYHYPAFIDDIGLNLMKKGAEMLVGHKDFCAFMAAGSSIKDTVRRIHYCRVDREGELIKISIAADGFLYNMVRIIVGTLLDVSSGRLSVEQIPEIIKSKKRENAGFTAPAHGLYLNKVVYKNLQL